MAYIRCGQTATASENKWFYQGLKKGRKFCWKIKKSVIDDMMNITQGQQESIMIL